MKLAALVFRTGDLASAEELFRDLVREKREAAVPTRIRVSALSGLGLVLSRRGKYDEAERATRDAIEVWEPIAPNSTKTASFYLNLGIIKLRRKDLLGAESLLDRALSLFRETAPLSMGEASVLNAMGVVREYMGDLVRAREAHEGALRIRESFAPEGTATSTSLHNLGKVNWLLGDVDRAEEYFDRALTIRKEVSSVSFQEAETLLTLGRLYFSVGRTSEASEALSRSAELWEEIAPQSPEHARVLHLIGLIRRGANEEGEVAADEYFTAALGILDDHMASIGGASMVRAEYRRRYGKIYRDAMMSKVAFGSPEQGFEILERSRARVFLEEISRRDFLIGDGDGRALDRERSRVRSKLETAMQSLLRLAVGGDSEKILEGRRRVHQLREESMFLKQRVRAVSPRLASLRYPQTVESSQAAFSLDNGTLLLSFSLGDESGVVFAVRKGGRPRVYQFEGGTRRIQELLDEWHQTLRGSSSPGRSSQSTKELPASVLYRMLLEPLEDLLFSSERVLLIPDGPLHSLPWGALMVAAKPDGVRRLSGRKAFHLTMSATVYAELVLERPEEKKDSVSRRLVAFGDPEYPRPRAEGVLEGEQDLGISPKRTYLGFRRLLHSRREVESISALFPADGYRVFVGTEATEEVAKDLAGEFDILHFAVHGRSYDHAPLESFLALAGG